MDEIFSVQFHLDAATYVNVLRRRIFGRLQPYVSILAGLLAGGFFYFSVSPAYFGPALGAAVAVVVFIKWWQAPVHYLKSARHLSEEKKVTFSPSRIEVETKSVRSAVSWTYFRSWSEDESYFFLDLDRYGFCSAIPKTCMSEAQRQQFREWAGAAFSKSTSPSNQ